MIKLNSFEMQMNEEEIINKWLREGRIRASTIKDINNEIRKEETHKTRQIKVYYCCICHKELEERPTRLVKQIYGAGRLNQYYPVANYDFCEKCYRKFENWLIKHNKEE